MQQVANIQTPEKILEAKQQAFIDIASKDKLVTWQEESQFAVEAMYNNPMLQKCSPVSVQNAIINVAACGLTLNPANGLAYLVPEYDKASKQQACKLRISFRGLMKVAVDSGAIDWVKAEIVREKDSFDYLGPCEKPVHKMNPFCKDRGPVIGVYCIAKTAKGDFLCDVMSKEEIDYIKSKAKTQFVWNDWYEEMAKKAIIKRASKQWPAGNVSRLSATIQSIDDAEGNEREINGQVINEPAQQNQEALPESYPDADFEANIGKWKAIIASGKKTPDSLVAFVESKGRKLTDDQKKQLWEVK